MKRSNKDILKERRRLSGPFQDAASTQSQELNESQQGGVLLGLTCEQVQVDNFGSHTINGILTLIEGVSGLSLDNGVVTVKKVVTEKSNYEVTSAILGLKGEILRFNNFIALVNNGKITLDGLPLDEFYSKVVGLDERQVKGALIGLTREQMLVDNFGLHTVHGIENLREQDNVLSLDDAYEKMKGLKNYEIDGLSYGLTREQMQVDNFGYHTVIGILTLLENISPDDAYEKVKGLDENQVKGALIGLTREQMQVDNFGSHTVGGIRTLLKRGISFDEAYEEVKELSEDKVLGFLLTLTREQMQVDNFDLHTVLGIKSLIKGGASLGEAYEKVKGLDENQVNNVITGLSSQARKQVNVGGFDVPALGLRIGTGGDNQNQLG